MSSESNRGDTYDDAEDDEGHVELVEDRAEVKKSLALCNQLPPIHLNEDQQDEGLRPIKFPINIIPDYSPLVKLRRRHEPSYTTRASRTSKKAPFAPDDSTRARTQLIRAFEEVIKESEEYSQRLTSGAERKIRWGPDSEKPKATSTDDRAANAKTGNAANAAAVAASVASKVCSISLLNTLNDSAQAATRRCQTFGAAKLSPSTLSRVLDASISQIRPMRLGDFFFVWVDSMAQPVMVGQGMPSFPTSVLVFSPPVSDCDVREVGREVSSSFRSRSVHQCIKFIEHHCPAIRTQREQQRVHRHTRNICTHSNKVELFTFGKAVPGTLM